MKLYKITKRAMKRYRNNVKGCKYLSDEVIQKKLTRNIELAVSHPITKHDTLHRYGCLSIFTHKNTVVWVVNDKQKWEKDIERYNELSKELGIETNI